MGPFQVLRVVPELARDNVGRARALLALADLEIDLLILVERRVPFGPDLRMVDKKVLAAVIRANEPESLR